MERHLLFLSAEIKELLREPGQFIPKFFIFPLRQIYFYQIIQRILLPGRNLRQHPESCQLLLGQAAHGRQQHRRHGNILIYIIHNGQIIKNKLHLSALEISGFALADRRNPRMTQQLRHDFRPSRAGTQQDNHILKCIAFLQKLPDPPGDHGRLRLHGIDFHRQILFLLVFHQKKHLRLLRFLFHGTALSGPQSNLRCVVHTAELSVHQVLKHLIGKRQHPRHTPEVIPQFDAHAACSAEAVLLPGASLFSFPPITVIAGQKQIRSRLTEPVNALLHVSHHKQVVLSFPADGI